MIDVNKELGKKIRQARKEAQMTQQDLGAKLDITGAAITYMEQGKRGITVEVLMRISRVTKKPFSFFYSDVVEGASPLDAKIHSFQGQLEELQKMLEVSIEQKQEVREREQLFYQAYEDSVDGIHITDLDGYLLYQNDASAEMLGYKPGECKGMHVSKFHNSESLSKEIIMPSLMKFGSWKGELILTKKNGEKLPVYLSASTIEDSNGLVKGFMGIIRDLSDMKTVKAEVKLYKKLIDQSADGSLLVDIETARILEANKKVCEMLGYDKEELTAMTVMDISHQITDNTKWKKHMDAIVKDRAVLRDGYQISRQGKLIPMEASCHLLHMGEHVYLSASIRYTEQKHIEVTQLKESELMFRSIAENSLDGMYLCDIDYNILYVNESYASMLGYTQKELIGKNYIPLLIDFDEQAQEIANNLSQRKAHKGSIYLKHRSGKRILVAYSAAVFEMGGKVVGVTGTATCISDSEKDMEHIVDEALKTHV